MLVNIIAKSSNQQYFQYKISVYLKFCWALSNELGSKDADKNTAEWF